MKNFNDGDFGGKSKALTAALAYRNQLWDAYGAPLPGGNRPLRGDNTSSMSGVARVGKGGPPGDDAWIASWPGEDGRQVKRKFSVPRYGEETAKALAMAERMLQMAELARKRGEIASAELWRARVGKEEVRQMTIATMLHRRSVKPKSNTSGSVGVSRTTLRGRVIWVASWTDEHGKAESRSFAVPVHGAKAAKELAIAERKKQMERLEKMVKRGIELAVTQRARKERGEKKGPKQRQKF